MAALNPMLGSSAQAARRAREMATLPTPQDSAWTARERHVADWILGASQIRCGECGCICPTELLPKARTTVRVSCDVCCGVDRPPRLRQYPPALRGLPADVRFMLRPLVPSQGEFWRHPHGYRRKDRLTRLRWAPESVAAAVQASGDGQARRAWRWLMHSMPEYRAWTRMHDAVLEEGRSRDLPPSALLTPLVEIALWPWLYVSREQCESAMYASEDWTPLSQAKSTPDNRKSMKALFALKLRSEVLDFNAEYDLLQFQFDRHVLRNLLMKTRIARAQGFDSRLLLDENWSPTYWRHHHACLLDLVAQLGYPTLFLTLSPYEWLFPWPRVVTDAYASLNCGPTDLPALEASAIGHVLREVSVRYLCGRGAHKRWRTHLLGDKLDGRQETVQAYYGRFEYQNGGRDKVVGRGRGSKHLHLLIWLREPERVLLNQVLCAKLPEEDAELEALARRVQPGDLPSIPINERSHWDRGTFHLAHDAEFRRLSLRPFVKSLLRLLRCAQDVQWGTKGALLLAYVTGYTTKYEETFDVRAIDDAETPLEAAILATNVWRPSAPEMAMVLQRGDMTFSNVCQVGFRPPSPMQQDPEEVTHYRRRPREEENSSLLEWLRVHYVAEGVARRRQRLGQLVAVGVDWMPLTYDWYFYQWLLMNIPHRRWQDLRHPEHVLFGEAYFWFASALRLAPLQWGSNAWIEGHLQGLGHRAEFVATELARLIAKRSIVRGLSDGTYSLRSITPAAAPRSRELSSEQRAFVAQVLRRCVAQQDLLMEDSFTARGCKKFWLLTGGPGSGKTLTCLSLARECGARMLRVLYAAPTGMLAASMPSAPLMTTATIHRAFALNRPDNDPSLWLASFAVWIVGEVGMVTEGMAKIILRHFYRLHHRVLLIFEGDFAQLPPPTEERDARAAFLPGRYHSTELHGQHRLTDDALKAITQQLRRARPSPASLAQLQTRVVGEELDMELLRHLHVQQHCMILAATRAEVRDINGALLAFETGEELRGIPLWDDDAIMHATLKRGCPVMVTANLDQGLGIVNGTIGTLRGTCPGGLVLEDAHGQCVAVHRRSQRVATEEGERLLSGFDVTLAYATTVHKVEGMTLPAVVLILGRFAPPGWGYTALTRVARFEDLCIIGTPAERHFIPRV